VISTDEKTGMQALERLHETKPVRPGLVERIEFEYIRHGTLSLIANFDVVTGKVVSPSIGPTRTEADFVAHIAQTIDTDPSASWIFVTDQLDTHRSSSSSSSSRDVAIFRTLSASKATMASWSRSRRAENSSRRSHTEFVSSTHHATALGSIKWKFGFQFSPDDFSKDPASPRSRICDRAR
jgi:hypothetical protein